jgi:hypothetical protein
LKGAPETYAFLSGPLVLAADLGPASQVFDGPAPALLARAGPTAALEAGKSAHRYSTVDVLGQRQDLKPFNALYDRRTAVYFATFTPADWAAQRQDYLAAEASRADLARRTVDIFHIGEMQPERDHGLAATGGKPGTFYGRHSRSIPEGAEVSFTMARRPGAAFLRVTYWGNDIDREMAIAFDGQEVAVERRSAPQREDWVTVDYPLPPSDRKHSNVRLLGRRRTSVVYGLELIEAPRRAA